MCLLLISGQYSGHIRFSEVFSSIEILCREWDMGYGLVPMLGGVFELVARTGIVVLIAGHTSFAGVCMADPTAWIAALIPLIPYYFHVMKKYKNKSQVQAVED